MSARKAWCIVLGSALSLCLSLLCATAGAATLSVGDPAPNFTLPEFGSGRPVSLYDEFAGKIVLLDFFAHWCGPCRTASSELEPQIQRYYAERGGNPDHIPVQMISLNVQGGAQVETQAYIDQYGLEMVLDDLAMQQFNQYGTGGIPQFAIVNGATGTNFRQWEILSMPLGYSAGRYASFRTIINGVHRVPEPGIWGLALSGALSLLLVRRSLVSRGR